MKNLNKISIILTLLITIFSCSKDDIVTNNQTQLSDEEKESIRNSDEFKKINFLCWHGWLWQNYHWEIICKKTQS